jgi:AcrR family transcriptional regulator
LHPVSRNGHPRLNIANIRRDEIIEAAIAIIAEQGIEHLSLSEIEKRAGMSRGQLTYYFRTKEQILLAVFDRLLALMYARMAEGHGPPPSDSSGWEMTQHLLRTVLLAPPISPEFHSLQYTFLSHIGHREDFRQRLAGLYEQWRGHMARGLERDRKSGTRSVRGRTMASLVQAILHGLAVQLVADEHAFDRKDMFYLCQDLLGKYLGLKANKFIAPAPNRAPQRRRPRKRGQSARPR